MNRRWPIHIFADITNSDRTRCGRSWASMAFTIDKDEAARIDWVKTGHAMCKECVSKSVSQEDYHELPEPKHPYR